MNDDPAATAYLDEVRSHLYDLDDDELQELTDDLVVHLQEVRAGSDDPFDRILGTPAAFAAELRASAGLTATPPAPEPAPPFAELRDRLTSVLGHPWVETARDFLPELRPAWWVARAFLVAVVLSSMTSSHVDGSSRLDFPIPRLFDSLVLGFVGLSAGIVVSVRAGRADYDPGWRRAVVLGTGGLAAIGLLVGASSLDERYPQYESVASADVGPDYSILPANIYAYDSDGQPLDRVFLFNETGEPVVLPRTGYSEWMQTPFQTLLPTDVDGNEVPNLYPRELLIEQYVDDGYGNNGASIRAIGPMSPRVPILPGIGAPTTLAPTETAPTTAVSPTTTPPRTTPPTTTAAPSTTEPSTTEPSTTSEPLRGLDGSIIEE